jgi:hypothetical protein
MKASELIRQLETLIAQHGDLDVLTNAGLYEGHAPAEAVHFMPDPYFDLGGFEESEKERFKKGVIRVESNLTL